MRQTENTAIVLRYVNYRDNDRMLTLLSPTRGLMEVLCRGCRRPRSPLLGASDLFALGDFETFERGGHLTVLSFNPIETFYPLRSDFDRLSCGIYLLNLAEASAQRGQDCRELFMLLLHTLSRLTFTDQPWKPLLTGFLLHYASVEGYKPRLNHCVSCGRTLTDGEAAYFSSEAGGLCCKSCSQPGQFPMLPEQTRWLRRALTSGSAGWNDSDDAIAPFTIMRSFVEGRLDRRLKSSAMLPEG